MHLFLLETSTTVEMGFEDLWMIDFLFSYKFTFPPSY